MDVVFEQALTTCRIRVTSEHDEAHAALARMTQPSDVLRSRKRSSLFRRDGSRIGRCHLAYTQRHVADLLSALSSARPEVADAVKLASDLIISRTPADFQRDRKALALRLGMPDDSFTSAAIEVTAEQEHLSVFKAFSPKSHGVHVGVSLLDFAPAMLDVFRRIPTCVASSVRSDGDWPDRLAAWLRSAWVAADWTGDAWSRSTIQYFATSSTIRATRINAALSGMTPPAGRIADLGAGIGSLSLLLRQIAPERYTSADLVEPLVAYAERAGDLWRIVAGEDIARVHAVRAEEYRPSDEIAVAVLAQMLYRVDQAEIAPLLDRLWAAVVPGGALVINEIMDQEVATIARPLLRSDDLLRWLPPTNLAFHFSDSTTSRALSADIAGDGRFGASTNLIVLRKDRH